jgi:preprotein translocase subunit SecG
MRTDPMDRGPRSKAGIYVQLRDSVDCGADCLGKCYSGQTYVTAGVSTTPFGGTSATMLIGRVIGNRIDRLIAALASILAVVAICLALFGSSVVETADLPDPPSDGGRARLDSTDLLA